MARIIFLIFNMVLLAVAIATGAVFFVVFAGIIAASALFIFLYMKITGRLPAGMRFYRFQQRTRYEEPQAPQGIKVIEAEYEEVKKYR
jgi:flagellar basal body-associated protein FliL